MCLRDLVIAALKYRSGSLDWGEVKRIKKLRNAYIVGTFALHR